MLFNAKQSFLLVTGISLGWYPHSISVIILLGRVTGVK